jgi:hypothetical protein
MRRELFDAIKSGDAESARGLLDRSPALVNASDEAGTFRSGKCLN